MAKTNDRAHRDDIEAVLANAGTCILSCLDLSGNPYLIPLLYEYADGGIYLVALEQTNWSQYLQRDGRVALYITGGARRVLIQGHAQQVNEPLYMRRLLDRRSAVLSESAGTSGRKLQPGRQAGRYSANLEQEIVDSKPGIPMWFFVRSLGLFIQRGGVWIGHNVTQIQSFGGPHSI